MIQARRMALLHQVRLQCPPTFLPCEHNRTQSKKLTSMHTEPVVKRPVKSKAKPKSKLNLSFGPDETSMTEDGEQESEVVVPKRHGLGRKAVERSTLKRNLTPSGGADTLSARVGHEQQQTYPREQRRSRIAHSARSIRRDVPRRARIILALPNWLGPACTTRGSSPGISPSLLS